MSKSPQNALSQFASDVAAGLSSDPKQLSSKYFYDDEGSRIFQQIMKLPEYYPTRCETEIFTTQTTEIFGAFTLGQPAFDLIELGAGDGAKTAILVEHFLAQKADFTYMPIDISAEALRSVKENFSAKFSMLKIQEKEGEYFRVLETLKETDPQRARVILFLGSNIGNFRKNEGIEFFRKLARAITPQDSVFIGFDLQKDPGVILRAYDDAAGVTAEFNLNLLHRINRELDADFVVESFSHYATYHPIECAARSYLISREKQTVNIRAIGRSFEFEQWEPIYMEISQKYSLKMIAEMAAQSGFRVAQNFFDSKGYYLNSLWKPQQ
jgi:dimethylhistidine N-methyltransferase